MKSSKMNEFIYTIISLVFGFVLMSVWLHLDIILVSWHHLDVAKQEGIIFGILTVIFTVYLFNKDSK